MEKTNFFISVTAWRIPSQTIENELTDYIQVSCNKQAEVTEFMKAVRQLSQNRGKDDVSAEKD